MKKLIFILSVLMLCNCFPTMGKMESPFHFDAELLSGYWHEKDNSTWWFGRGYDADTIFSLCTPDTCADYVFMPGDSIAFLGASYKFSMVFKETFGNHELHLYGRDTVYLYIKRN